MRDRPDLRAALEGAEEHGDAVRIDRRTRWGKPISDRQAWHPRGGHRALPLLALAKGQERRIPRGAARRLERQETGLPSAAVPRRRSREGREVGTCAARGRYDTAARHTGRGGTRPGPDLCRRRRPQDAGSGAARNAGRRRWSKLDEWLSAAKDGPKTEFAPDARSLRESPLTGAMPYGQSGSRTG